MIDGGSGRAWGKTLRKETPRSSHAEWSPDPARPDSIDLITGQNGPRLQWLVPVRHHRMSQSAFTFFRGSAIVMASDLASTPTSGITAQICGDAHLSNFGVYGSPERELVFDVNDFDETLPGPWEWDVKRLTASFAIAARNLGYDDVQRDAAAAAARAYREAMAEFAEMRYIDAWYADLAADAILDGFRDQMSSKQTKKGRKFISKARKKNSLKALKSLAEEVDGGYRIAAQPPLVVPLRDLPAAAGEVDVDAFVRAQLDTYLQTVPDSLESLLNRYTPVDAAIKVVGVGSVGTRCAVVLLEGKDAGDPLFLQVKEASRSVLEDHLPASRYANHGERVVEGQQLMQATSDIFLGWTHGRVAERHYYWRQLKDMKGSPDVDNASVDELFRFAGLCGWTLARAHSRSADMAAIAGYLGSGDVFDRAIAEFSVAYADQNERDYAAFTEAIESGRIEATEG